MRAREIYRRLAQRHQVTLITGLFPGAQREEEIDGIHFVRVGSDASPVMVHATSDINVINSAMWRCVLVLTAMALSSRAAKAVICEGLLKATEGSEST